MEFESLIFENFWENETPKAPFFSNIPLSSLMKKCPRTPSNVEWMSLKNQTRDSEMSEINQKK